MNLFFNSLCLNCVTLVDLIFFVVDCEGEGEYDYKSGSCALPGKMLLVRIIEIDDHFRSG